MAGSYFVASREKTADELKQYPEGGNKISVPVEQLDMDRFIQAGWHIDEIPTISDPGHRMQSMPSIPGVPGNFSSATQLAPATASAVSSVPASSSGQTGLMLVKRPRTPLESVHKDLANTYVEIKEVDLDRFMQNGFSVVQ